MGVTEILTIIFVVCKIAGIIDWSWVVVFLPEIIAVVLYIGWFVFVGRIFHKTSKSIEKSFDDDFFKF